MLLMDFLEITSISCVAIGLMLNAWVVLKSNKQKRAEFLLGLYNQVLNEGIIDLLIKLESNKIKNFNKDRPSEIQLNKILGIYDSIGHLRHLNNFSNFDLEYFAFEIIYLNNNPIVRKYLDELKESYKSKGYPESILPFSDFEYLYKLILKMSSIQKSRTGFNYYIPES